MTSALGEASGAHRDDDAVYEFLRGENLRPQWLVVEFESDRVSRVHMELNQDRPLGSPPNKRIQLTRKR